MKLITAKDIEEAKKISSKAEENYMVLHFNYDSIIVKYSDGLNILKGFNSAEMYKDSYSTGQSIFPVPKGHIKAELISTSTYQNAKSAALLGITSKELEELLAAGDTEEDEDL